MRGEAKTGATLRNTVFANVTALAMNVGASAIAARMLGPMGRGGYSVIQLWPITAAGLGTIGIPRAVAYYVGKRGAGDESALATGAAMLGGAALASGIALYFAMPLLTASQPHAVMVYARWCLLLLPLLYWGTLPYFVLQGLNRMRTWNLVRCQFPVLWLAMHLVGWVLGRRDLKFYAMGYIAVTAVHNLTWIGLLVARFPLWGRVRRETARRLVDYGVPLTLGSMPQYLNLRLDQILMAALVPPRVLGLYVTAVAWSGIILPALTALSQVMFPAMIGLDDGERQYALLGRSVRLSALGAVACAAVAVAAAPVAIPLLFGRAFQDAVAPAAILSVGSVFLAMNGVLSEGFRALGKPRYPMIAELAGFAATAALLCALLPRWPLLGASVASVVSYALTTVVLLGSAARTGATTVSDLVAPRRADFAVLRRLAREACG